jgi:hypothetical protein
MAEDSESAKKLIGCVCDPTGFKKPDGPLDLAAMAHEMVEWSQKRKFMMPRK